MLKKNDAFIIDSPTYFSPELIALVIVYKNDLYFNRPNGTMVQLKKIIKSHQVNSTTSEVCECIKYHC